LGNFDADHPWELCTTLAGGAWGWKTNAAIKPLRDCILLLVKAAGRDGNFILNVGPRPDGQIDPPQAARLKEVGEWLGKFGESIYGTRGGPFLPGAYGVSTHRDRRIYAHVLNRVEAGKLALPALPVKILHASVLGGGEASFSQSEQRVEVSLPVASQDSLDTIVVLDLEQSANGLKPIPVGP
jgi:alpha-L-fucosidase